MHPTGGEDESRDELFTNSEITSRCETQDAYDPFVFFVQNWPRTGRYAPTATSRIPGGRARGVGFIAGEPRAPGRLQAQGRLQFLTGPKHRAPQPFSALEPILRRIYECHQAPFMRPAQFSNVIHGHEYRRALDERTNFTEEQLIDQSKRP